MISIKNYGFMWERQGVFFGKPGISGTLLGSSKRIKQVDFREQSGVYVLYDRHMVPVYVGQAGLGNSKLFERLRQHTKDHLWNRWDYFSWFGLCEVNNTGKLHMSDRPSRKLSGTVISALHEIEAILIQILEPKLNKQGPKWEDTEEYFQIEDDNIEDVSLETIYFKQNELEKLLKKVKVK